MEKIKVLFVCIHNSARSQMAEAFLKVFGGEMFDVKSAGLEPGKLNPIVVMAMKEVGIDISGNQTKSVFDFFKTGELFSYVVTVCDETSGQSCPIFPGVSKKLHWSFADPSALNGTYEEKLQDIRKIRDMIKEKVVQFISEFKK
ncbi:MAG: arsenate reductase ArsC [Endomicrobiales bacterium]|nr:arsenate reductase ArsC [Endomicrobiales bacterium]